MSQTINDQESAFGQLYEDVQEEICLLPGTEPRAGQICPHCHQGRLDYDGKLDLTCLECGYTLSGCPT